MLRIITLWIIVLLASTVLNASTTCVNNFSSGSGPTMVHFCLTENGNITVMTAGGYALIGGSEGYGVCLPGGGSVYDVGAADSGNWSASTIIQPNGINTFPVTITRGTVDGNITLSQTFTFGNAGKTVRVKTSVFSFYYGSNTLVRYAHSSIQSPMSDRVPRSAFIWNGSLIGLMGSPSNTPKVGAGIVIGTVTDPCSAQTPAQFPFAGDSGIVLGWSFQGKHKFSATFDYVPMM